MERLALDAVLSHCMERHALSAPARSVEEAAVRAACIYGSAPTCYMSAAVRLHDFRPGTLESLNLQPVSIDGLRGSFVSPTSLLDGMSPRAGEDVASLLPYCDTYVMSHADRTRYLDPQWMQHVVHRGGDVTNVILRNGRVVGI